jgi:hypothetical protein
MSKNSFYLISSKNSNAQISRSSLIPDKTPDQKEKAQIFFSFKTKKEVNKDKPNTYQNKNNNNNLSISIIRTNEKSPIKDYNNSRRQISNTDKKNTIQQSFLATTGNLNDSSDQHVTKSKLHPREKRNSVLVDILRSVIIEKNSTRKYMATTKDNSKRGKNKFLVYDSSDSSDSEICKKNAFLIKFFKKLKFGFL